MMMDCLVKSKMTRCEKQRLPHCSQGSNELLRSGGEELPKALSCPFCKSMNTHFTTPTISLFNQKLRGHKCGNCHNRWVPSSKILERGKSHESSTVSMDTALTDLDVDRPIARPTARPIPGLDSLPHWLKDNVHTHERIHKLAPGVSQQLGNSSTSPGPTRKRTSDRPTVAAVLKKPRIGRDGKSHRTQVEPPEESTTQGRITKPIPEVSSLEDHNVLNHKKKIARQLAPGGGSGQRGNSSTSSSTFRRPTPNKRGEGVGTHHNSKSNIWEAYLRVRGVRIEGHKKSGMQICLGQFNTETEAQKAHDRATIKFRETVWAVKLVDGPLHFPEAEYKSFIAEHANWNFRDVLWEIRRSSPTFTTGQSKMRGVSVRRGLYKAAIGYTHNGGKKTPTLGLFKSEVDAGRAYDLALLFLKSNLTEPEVWHCIPNSRPSTYSVDEIEQAGLTYKLSRPEKKKKQKEAVRPTHL